MPAVVDLTLKTAPQRDLLWIAGPPCRTWWTAAARGSRSSTGEEVRLRARSPTGWTRPARTLFADPLAVLLATAQAAPFTGGPCVYVALPHLGHARAMLHALAWLGVARVVPLCCERGSAVSRSAHHLALLRADTGLHLEDPVDLTTALGARPLWLDPAAEAALGPPADALLLGPEGGFTPGETAALADAGLARRHLGPDVLRTQTAAVTAVARLVLGPPSAVHAAP